MSMRAAAVALVFAAACGVTDPSQESAPLPGGDELESTGAELTTSYASVWWPMQEGNTWKFTSATSGRTLSYSDVSQGIAFFSGLIPDGRWVGYSSSAPNSAYTWNDTAGTWEPFIRFGYSTTAWTWGSGPCSTYQVRRTATGQTVTGAAGTFTDTRTIGFLLTPAPTARCVAPPFDSITFAANVGPVAFTTPNGERFVLTSAKVGTTAYPRSTSTGSVKGALRFDASSYVNEPNTIFCIRAPCPSNAKTAVAHATYTVTNGTSTSATWQFSSGCQFNIDLVNSSGTVVKSLSDDRFCTQSLTSITLAPGQSKTFTADLELAGRTGEQLSGTFTGKAYLSPRTTAPSASASASFSVKIQSP